ncbi:Putative ribonuclease H protein At1g65750 [Linum perenne]
MNDVKNFMENNDLTDMGCNGDPFTWFNGRKGTVLIKERLDRALINPDWRIRYDEAQVFHENKIGSDHRPIRLTLNGRRRKFSAPFRFDSRWISDPKCDNIIFGLMPPNHSGNSSTFMTNCTSHLKAWSATIREDDQERTEFIKRRLEVILSEVRSDTIIAEENELLLKLDSLWKNKEKRWSQRANIRWLAEGDKNTRFFHTMVVHRKHRNNISRLKDDNRRWVASDSGIERMTTQYFTDLFTARDTTTNLQNIQDIPRIMRDEMNATLIAEVSDVEIRKAVFSLGANQSPGPDGYPGHFFRRYWLTIGPMVYKEIKEFFRSNSMPNSWNDTHLVLIPKTPNPTTLAHFRPISCCNFKYKVISKIMALRLKLWIADLIPETQSAFTGGRAIQDNIIVVHEVLHSFRTRINKKEDLCLKLDMRKAYDLVDWECLDLLLRRYGFAAKWCDWISSCICTVRFSILFNGRPTYQFSPSRGIRQGDPLSPFLFILMTNALSHLINRSVDRKILHDITLTRNGPKITHCLFADDTIVFGKASISEVDKIIQTINDYGAIIGQEINNAKSAVYFSRNVDANLKRAIVQKLGCSTGHSRYLGVPTEWGRSRKETFNFLLERMSKIAQPWKSSMLSPTGKETLIKSVIQAIPTYIMSLFLLPNAITNRMNAMLRNFFWLGDPNKRSMHWSHADVLCASKREAGLGFRDFRSFNLALLAKQAWILLTRSSPLWVRLLKCRYFPRTTFEDAKKGSRPSWIWASLCDARNVLDLGCIRVIGNGKTTSLVKDPWIPSLPSRHLHSTVGPFKTVDDWITNDPRGWNHASLDFYCNSPQKEAISSIPIGPIDMEDAWKWRFTKNGEFSVRTAYHAQFMENDDRRPLPRHVRNVNSGQWKWLWSLSLPPKIKFFLWRCVHNILATTANLHRRNCAPSPTCQLCSAQEESTLHCLFFCPHAARAWDCLGFLPEAIPPNNASFVSFFFDFQVNNSPVDIILWSAVCWNIWKARNSKIFKNQLPFNQLVANQACADASTWRTLSHLRPSNIS